MSFAASDVDSFVAKHGWLLLKFSGRALSVDSVGESQKKFIASVITQMTDTSFMDTRKVLQLFREGTGCNERLFNNVSMYRFLLCYCGFSIVLIKRPHEKQVLSYVCATTESPALLRVVLTIMNLGAEEDENVRVRKTMDFLEKCAVQALDGGAPKGFVLKRQKELSMAVCKSVEMVLDGLHNGAARLKFRRRWATFCSRFRSVELADSASWAGAAGAVALSVFTPAKSTISGRPSILSQYPDFLNALESVIEECGGKAHARLQEMAYAAGSNASAFIYKERLRLNWGIDIAASTVLTYLAPRNSTFRAAQRHSPHHLLFRPVLQMKDVGSEHVDVHYCRADVKAVLSLSHSTAFACGTITCASDVKATIYTSNSRVAPTMTLTKSWRPIDDDGNKDAVHVNAHDFDKSKDTSLCANGFLFLDPSDKRDPGSFSRRGQGIYAVRNVGVIPHSSSQILNDLFFGLEIVASSAETKKQVLKCENTFSRWVEVTDSGPVVAPSKYATQLGLAFFFCCFSLDILIRVSYCAQDSKMNPVERLHAALSRVFGLPIVRGDGDAGLFDSGVKLVDQMENPGFSFANHNVKAAAWKSDDLVGFVPPVLVQYISSRDSDLVDLEVVLPQRLVNLIQAFHRPPPGAITIRRLVDLLESGHGGFSATRCTIARCNVASCGCCGGVCERTPFPLMNDLQFPYPVPDPTNATHYISWYSLVTGSALDESAVSYCFRPSFLVSLHITGCLFQPGNFREARLRKSELVRRLSQDCRVSCASEKMLLMQEMQKQIERHLRKHAMTETSLTICGVCERRVLILDVGHCSTCASNLCSVCSPNHTDGHAVGPPELLCDDIDWVDALRTGLVNGFRLTKAMLCNRLKATGAWEPRFRQWRKDKLLKKLKDFIQCP
jgi:hypothetical protein